MTVFCVRLSEQEWVDEDRAWRCQVFEIPSATVTEIRAAGEVISPEMYHTDLGVKRIYWKGEVGAHPKSILVRIALQDSLVTKHRADARVMVALIGAVGGVLTTIITMWPARGPVDAPPPEDDAVEIRQKLEEAKRYCKDDAECVIKKVGASVDGVRKPASSRISNVLLSDLLIGNALLDDEDVSGYLNELFGIESSSFLGTGFAHPRGRPYGREVVHEYLIPQMEERARANGLVQRWSIEPANQVLAAPVNKILTDVNMFVPRIESGLSVGEETLKKWNKECEDRRDEPRVFLRFQQFQTPSAEAITHIGRPGSRRVFVANYCEVRDMSLEEAGDAVGYRLTDASANTIHVWAIELVNRNYATLATWSNVLSEWDEWVE